MFFNIDFCHYSSKPVHTHTFIVYFKNKQLSYPLRFLSKNEKNNFKPQN